MTSHSVRAIPSAWTGLLPTKDFALGYVGAVGMWITGKEVVRIQDGRGLLLSVKHGSVWMTQAGSIKDVFIGAGESFRVECDGLTLLSLGETGSTAVVTLMRSSRAGLSTRLADGVRRILDAAAAWGQWGMAPAGLRAGGFGRTA